jgi:hypothetical protein
MSGFMNIVIFSKDRPAQLDLFLRSMKRFYPEWGLSREIHVLYTYSAEYYGSGYVKVITMHPDISYVYENPNGFKTDLLNLITRENPLTVFFVDDNVFKDNFILKSEEMKIFLRREDIICLSLRLYPKINYCYTMNIPVQLPSFVEEKNMWRWGDATPGDWSYPMSLDGHIFKTDDIFSLLIQLDYTNPNTLEGQLACHPVNLPYMICYENSKIINIPANKVQSENTNRHGNISSFDLNEKFLSGYRLSLNKLLDKEVFKNNTSCHQEMELEWD